eukprot:TRINITY_DN14249_c0_g3_i1.p1 TRINITY_DN14249_c0_g3~~TRINITY_DN14249_c0_g3_i1.p1  ORF type:complete len:638 (+),score=71.16 TRINITY_DN14249_c0_g3_i1:57-1970(+)
MSSCPSPFKVYTDWRPSPEAQKHLFAAQLASERGDVSASNAALAKGAALGDSLSMYNLAANLCNPGSCQDLQLGAGCYLFLLRRNKHFPSEAAAVLLAAVENFAMMLRQLGGVGGVPRAAELPFDALSSLRMVAKGPKDRARTAPKKDVSLRVAANAARVIVHFTDGFLSWDTSRHRVVKGESFTSEGVQALRRAAIRAYGKALDLGKDIPRSVGDPMIDQILPCVHDHLELAKSNTEQLTQNQMEQRLQGVVNSNSDFLGLGQDGELRFIPAAQQRPWLSDSTEDRQWFFSGFHAGAHPQLKEQTCAVCSETRNLQKCSGCKQVYYCCREHQQSHWPEHKSSCRTRASGSCAENVTPEAQTSQITQRHAKSENESCGGDLEVGRYVQLCGLKSSKDLVGLRGSLESVVSSTGRWVVKLESGRVVKVQPENLFVVPRLLSKYFGEALTQKQEADFLSRSVRIRECVQTLYYHTAPETGSGATFKDEFEQAWRQMSLNERKTFLRSADEALLIEQGQGPHGLGMIAAAFAAAELRDEALVRKPQTALDYLEAAMAGKVPNLNFTRECGHAVSVHNDAFLQRLVLSVGGFNIEELKGHPDKLDFELRIVRAYGFYFRAEFALKVVDTYMARLGLEVPST